MNEVHAKKHLGQHFLKDKNIARKITESLRPISKNLLEIGPGTGVLTQFLITNNELSFYAIDIDSESIDFLHQKFPEFKERIILGDFLKKNLRELFSEPFSVIGNFPYNISSQIFFKIISERDLIPQIVCMIQKEVAERISSPSGNKTYGILSVFLQAFYDIEYLFTVNEQVFTPPPKVKSGVIRLLRNSRESLGCDEKLFFTIVKTAFNQRRKTMRNSLKALIPEGFTSEKLSLRPEQLSVDDFLEFISEIDSLRKRDQ